MSRVIASNGYVLIRVGKDHHLADVRGYAYEHRLVAERMLGRRLLPGEIPHHKNGNKQDNREDNLEVVSSIADHLALHRKPGSKRRLPSEPNAIIKCACGCGKRMDKFDSNGRPRRFALGHNPSPRPKQDALLDACARAGGGGASVSEIAALTGNPICSVRTTASKLVKAGKLIRISRGIYVRKN